MKTIAKTIICTLALMLACGAVIGWAVLASAGWFYFFDCGGSWLWLAFPVSLALVIMLVFVLAGYIMATGTTNDRDV